MNQLAVGVGGACALAVTAPLAWAVARAWAGVHSMPSYEEWKRVLASEAGGVVIGAAVTVAYPGLATFLALVIFGLAGVAGGAAVGWVTRAAEDRSRR